MQAEPVRVFQSPNIVRDLRALPEFKIVAQQFRDDLGHKLVEHKKKIKTDGYKCDACGNAVCWVHPREAWGLPTRGCMYDVGVPVNWRKAKRQRTTNQVRRKAKS